MSPTVGLHYALLAPHTDPVGSDESDDDDDDDGDDTEEEVDSSEKQASDDEDDDVIVVGEKGFADTVTGACDLSALEDQRARDGFILKRDPSLPPVQNDGRRGWRERVDRYRSLPAEGSQPDQRIPDDNCQVDELVQGQESFYRFLGKFGADLVTPNRLGTKGPKLVEQVESFPIRYHGTTTSYSHIHRGSKQFALPIDQALSYLEANPKIANGRPAVLIDSVSAIVKSAIVHKAHLRWMLRWCESFPGNVMILEIDNLLYGSPMPSRPTLRVVVFAGGDPMIPEKTLHKLRSMLAYRKGTHWAGAKSFMLVANTGGLQRSLAGRKGIDRSIQHLASRLVAALSNPVPSGPKPPLSSLAATAASSPPKRLPFTRQGAFVLNVKLARAVEDAYRQGNTGPVVVSEDMTCKQGRDVTVVKVAIAGQLCTRAQGRELQRAYDGIRDEERQLVTLEDGYVAAQDVLGPLYNKRGNCMFAQLPSRLSNDPTINGFFYTVTVNGKRLASYLYAADPVSRAVYADLQRRRATSTAAYRMIRTNLDVQSDGTIGRIIPATTARANKTNTRRLPTTKKLQWPKQPTQPKLSQPQGPPKRRGRARTCPPPPPLSTRAQELGRYLATHLPNLSPRTWTAQPDLGDAVNDYAASLGVISKDDLARIWRYGRAILVKEGKWDESVAASSAGSNEEYTALFPKQEKPGKVRPRDYDLQLLDGYSPSGARNRWS